MGPTALPAPQSPMTWFGKVRYLFAEGGCGMGEVDATGELSGVLGLLQRVSRTLDLMWRSAVSDGSGTALRLGEASHGVHRAIIALSAAVPERERRERATVAR